MNDAFPTSALRDASAYTSDLFRSTRIGHTRITQAFGSPTLIWHVGIWPKPQTDPNNARASQLAHWEVCAEYNARLRTMRDHLNSLIEKLQRRGRAGSGRDDRFECIESPATNGEAGVCNWNKESINLTLWWADSDADSAASEQDKFRPRCRPIESDIRVRVQFEIHPDFATVTFFIDVSKLWDKHELIYDSTHTTGRRKRILDVVNAVKAFCEPRVLDGSAEYDLLPERGVSTAAQALRDQSDFLYQNIWHEFSAAFGIDLTQLAGDVAEVFVNQRGVVMSTRGSTEPSKAAKPEETASAGLQRFRRFVPEEEHPKKENEPNAVVKAFWPFIRRMRTDADHRDWIACGVLNWRAIYIGSLGAQSQYDAHLRDPKSPHAAILDEGQRQDDSTLPQRVSISDGDYPPDYTGPRTPEKDLPAPFRFLLLTKYEPNRKQIGRLVDRINSLATYQLYAFKNFDALCTASVKVRMFGQELDGVLTEWIERSRERTQTRNEEIRQEIRRQLTSLSIYRESPSSAPIRADVQTVLGNLSSTLTLVEARRALDQLVGLADTAAEVDGALLLRYSNGDKEALAEMRRRKLSVGDRSGGIAWSKKFRRARRDAFRALHDQCDRYRGAIRRLKSMRDEDMAQANQDAEYRLLEISAGLDRLGQGAAGGIQYRINRSRYYAGLYRDLIRTLRCGNIETWWTYEQYASRGVEPALGFIDSLGGRLERLRDRLGRTMENVQTNAIVNQTEATRDNTFQLELIANNVNHLAEKTDKLQEDASDLEKWVKWSAIIGVPLGIVGVLFAGLGIWKELVALWETIAPRLGL